MILNIYGNDTKDDIISKLRKTKGIKYISKYLPNINANKQGYIVNNIDEWREIKNKYPEIVTCRTDSLVGEENINAHGATRNKDDIDNYIIANSEKFRNPYFICLELEEGTNERIYTKGAFLIDLTVGQDIKVGYVGPGFDCGELTKGISEHETWVIPWDKNSIYRKDCQDRFRINTIDERGYFLSVVERAKFLVKEYPDRKEEILDLFLHQYSKFSGITPELFQILQEEVLIPMYEKQELLTQDKLSHCGIELNVVGNNRLVPFEIETNEVFKAYSGQIKQVPTDSKEQEYMKYGKARGILRLKKYLPNLDPFENIRIVKSVEEWNEIESQYPDRVNIRTDTKIGDSKNVRVEGTNGKKDSIPLLFEQIKKQNPDAVLLLLPTKRPTILRYENDGGFNVGINIGDSVVIEMVGQGFDAREITREKAVHERYVIPWDRILFIKDKKDLQKEEKSNRFLKEFGVSTYQISQKDYEETRKERVAFLNSFKDYDKQAVEEAVPTEYKPIDDEILDYIIEKIVFPMYQKQNELARDGLRNCTVQGNIVNKIPEPWEIFSPERLIAKSKNGNQER